MLDRKRWAFAIWLAGLAIMFAWPSNRAWAVFTFTPVIEGGITPVPLADGTTEGTFNGNTLISASIDGDRIAFYGSNGGILGRGIYTATLGGTVEVVADRRTQIPDRAEGVEFWTFGANLPNIDNGEVVFYGENTTFEDAEFGVYRKDVSDPDNPLVTVVDENSPVPDHAEWSYSLVQDVPTIAEGVALYAATTRVTLSGEPAPEGYFAHQNDTVTPITIRIGPGFEALGFYPQTDGTNFVGIFTDILDPDVLYRTDGTTNTLLATVGNSLPDGDGTLGDFGAPGNLAIEGQNVLFQAGISNSAAGHLSDDGLFLHDGTSLEIIAREGDTIGNSTDPFVNFGDFVDISEGHYVFTASTSESGSGRSLFSTLGGALTRVLSVGDTLGGGVVETIQIQPGAIDGNRIAFYVTMDGAPDGIYVAEFFPVPAGDYNDDGIVNAADYTAWRDNLGAPAGTLPNDVDGGTIGQDQYDTWVANFGRTFNQGGASLATAAVPEPASAALLALATGVALLRNRRVGNLVSGTR